MTNKPAKRLAIIFSLFAGLCVMAHAQETTTYYTKTGAHTTERDSAHYSRVLRTQANADNLFELNEYFLDGTLRRHGYVQAPDPTRLRFEGELTTYHENGNLLATEWYRDNTTVDTAAYYYANGTLKERRAFLGIKSNVNGTSRPQMDTRTLYYADSLGNIQVENGQGEALLTLGDDVEQGHFTDGLRTGHWTGTFFKGKNTFEEWYENGELTKGITTDSTGRTHPYSDNMVDPTYPGGIQELMKFVAQNYRFPPQALREKVAGQVLIGFVVERDGSMGEYKIINDLGHGTGAAAIAAIKRAQKWSPAYMRGVPVRVSYMLPVRLSQ